VPQTSAEIKLNLSAYSKGDLYRAIKKLKKYRFRAKSYSLFFALIAEHSAEAYMDTPFPGQLTPSAKKKQKRSI
jgi:hypothetical protein